MRCKSVSSPLSSQPYSDILETNLRVGFHLGNWSETIAIAGRSEDRKTKWSRWGSVVVEWPLLRIKLERLDSTLVTEQKSLVGVKLSRPIGLDGVW